jgi:hypothetical protein
VVQLPVKTRPTLKPPTLSGSVKLEAVGIVGYCYTQGNILIEDCASPVQSDVICVCMALREVIVTCR